MTEKQTDNQAQRRRPVSMRRTRPVETPPPEESERNTIGDYQILLEAVIDLSRCLWRIATAGAILQVVVVIVGFALITPGKAREYAPLEICHHGMKALFEKSDDGELIHPSVLEKFKKHDFPFRRITSVRVKDSANCTVSARFAKRKRTWRVKLEKSPHFKRGRRILDARRIK